VVGAKQFKWRDRISNETEVVAILLSNAHARVLAARHPVLGRLTEMLQQFSIDMLTRTDRTCMKADVIVGRELYALTFSAQKDMSG